MATGGGASETGKMIPRKPRALIFESVVAAFAPASPGSDERTSAGLQELKRIGFQAVGRSSIKGEGYFAGSVQGRLQELAGAIENEAVDGLVAIRGGYGSNYLLEELTISRPDLAKVILGFSDLSSLQIYLWQKHGWVTFYGPMLAAGLDAGPGVAKGYERESLLAALQKIKDGWTVRLQGQTLAAGEAEGRVLGGCMTLVETTIGTPWELETRDAILLLEDRAMKPWQVDRALMHLKQAGKFNGVKGILLGDFPECEVPVAGSPTVREVCERILGPLGVPIVFGAPVGHTERAMLTIPLGIMGRLKAEGEGVLEILEPAVVA